MKPSLQCGAVLIKKSPVSGYGVFANQDFAQGDIIEECHSLKVSTSETELKNYYFAANSKLKIIPLGYGCIYNHSQFPNADWEYFADDNLLVYTAIRPIKAGEEILISYGQHWFSIRKMKDKTISFFWPECRAAIFVSLRFVGVLLFIFLLVYFFNANF